MLLDYHSFYGDQGQAPHGSPSPSMPGWLPPSLLPPTPRKPDRRPRPAAVHLRFEVVLPAMEASAVARVRQKAQIRFGAFAATVSAMTADVVAAVRFGVSAVAVLRSSRASAHASLRTPVSAEVELSILSSDASARSGARATVLAESHAPEAHAEGGTAIGPSALQHGQALQSQHEQALDIAADDADVIALLLQHLADEDDDWDVE